MFNIQKISFLQAEPEWLRRIDRLHRTLDPRSQPMLACGKVLDQKGSAAMLAIKRLAGVAPKVNLRIHCTQVRKHISEEFAMTLEPRADITRGPKQGYQWHHKRTNVLHTF